METSKYTRYKLFDLLLMS